MMKPSPSTRLPMMSNVFSSQPCGAGEGRSRVGRALCERVCVRCRRLNDRWQSTHADFVVDERADDNEPEGQDECDRVSEDQHTRAIAAAAVRVLVALIKVRTSAGLGGAARDIAIVLLEEVGRGRSIAAAHG